MTHDLQPLAREIDHRVGRTDHREETENPSGQIGSNDNNPSPAPSHSRETIGGEKQAEPATPVEFLDTIFVGITPEETICLSRARKRGSFINTPHDSRANRNVLKGVDSMPAYYNISTLQPAEGEDIYRRTSDRCVACYAVVLDDVGSKKVVDPDTIPVVPDWKIESSPGNFQWGYIIDRMTDLEAVSLFIQWLAHKGYTDRGAKGFNRLMRLPGSVHATKKDPETGEPWRARLHHWDPVGGTLEDLMADFGCTPEELTNLPNKRRAPPGSPIIKHLAVDAEDELLNWLSEQGYLLSDPDKEREWVDFICPWHRLHSDGNVTASYSPLGHGRADGAFMDSRQFNCFHAHSLGEGDAAGVKTWDDFIRWVESEGGPVVQQKDPIALYAARYGWVGAEEKYVDMDARGQGNEMLGKAAMEALFEGRVVQNHAGNWVKAINLFNQDPRVKKFAAREFNPAAGEDKGFSKPNDDRLYYNTFVRPEHAPTEQEPEAFLNHMDYLIPDEAEREVFLDWLAHKVQRPGERAYSVLMVTDGGQGVGRSIIGDYLKEVWPKSVATTELATLLGKGKAGNDTFNDWHVGKLWAVINEARAGIDREDFYHGYESFKEWVDSRAAECMTNSKYGVKRLETVWFNLLMISNHVDALHIPSDDRRVMVIRNPDKRKTRAEYEPLWRELREEEGGRKLYWYLMNRELNAFDNIYPPSTPAKVQMIEAGVSHQDDLFSAVVVYIKQVDCRFMSRPQLDDFVGAVALVEYGDDGADRNEVRKVVGRLWTKEFASIGDGEGTLRVRVDDAQARYRGFRSLLQGQDLAYIDGDEVRSVTLSQKCPINKGNKVLISQYLKDL